MKQLYRRKQLATFPILTLFALLLTTTSLTLRAQEFSPQIGNINRGINTNFNYFGYWYGVGTYFDISQMDHISAYSNTVFVSTELQLQTASSLGMKSIVVLSGTFFDTNGNLLPNWKTNWQDKWDNWLYPNRSKIRALYPMDEPDINNKDYNDYVSVVNQIQNSMNTSQADIPILEVVSYLGVDKIQSGEIIIPESIDWLAFDEYGCWDTDCYQEIPIPDKLDVLIDIMEPRGKKVVLISDGFKASSAPPSINEQQAWVARNQKYFDLCATRASCIGLLTFLWPSFPESNIIGVVNMSAVENDLSRMGSIIINGVSNESSYLGELISQNKPVLAKNQHSTTPATNVVDGNINTSWNAGDYPEQWIEIDLHKERSINGIRLLVNQSPSSVTKHNIWVADNSKQYRLVHYFYSHTKDKEILQKTFFPNLDSTRYIKIETTQSNSWVAWYEIEVYSSALTIVGDINNDGIVNIQDYILLSNAFGTNDQSADLNNDGIVNIQDYIILSNNFGYSI